MTIEKILFYGIIIVGAALIIGLTYYRIDWARHPEKYQDLVDQAEKDEKEAAQRRAMRRLGRGDFVSQYKRSSSSMVA